MSGPKFFQSVMGQRFYGGHVPELITALVKIADALLRIAVALEKKHD